MNRLKHVVFWTLLTLASLPSLHALDSDWPRTVPLGQGMVTIYLPQVDAMNDDVIQYRAALAYRETPGADPVFGAGWFESTVKIDSVNRIVHPMEFTLTEARFPEGTDDIQSELAVVLAKESTAWKMDFSLDDLNADLKLAESETKAVNTTPPKIVYRDHPALLISIDGEPVLREVENSPYKAVINTPYPLISDGKYFYLNAAKDVWYRARRATGPYQFEPTPPEAIAAMVNPDDEAETESEPSEKITAANAPEIVVSTEPAELIVTEGPAAFVPLVDDLLVLQNSDDDVFMHVSSQQFFIVLAGRWYRADSLTGPWVFQAADGLPRAFADIPRDSSQADSRVYVAGTQESKDAVLDAQIPQTAAVKRGEVDIDVEYDGEPVYQPVDGTDLVYIQNTGSTVLVSGGLYYLVEEGVWYVSSSANGPWQVSDHRPEQVDTILPTSPVYNTKYVHVYESTPSVVYVGYTPGYTGSYVYRNTIFYGTGWYYRPWVSPYYYYPRFSTWGFNVSYSSWYGWNFGLSWGWGPFSVNYYSGGYWHHGHHWYHRHHGRWGPGRYHHRRGHHRYAHNGHRGGGRGYSNDRRNGNGRDRNGNGNGRDRGGNAGPRDNGQNRNLYRDGSQRASVANTRDRQTRPSNRNTGDSRQVNTLAANGMRVRSNGGNGKSQRSRTQPVSSTELRRKANVRDINKEAKRSRLLADNGGRIYSKAGRKSSGKSQLGGGGSKQRSTQLASVQPTNIRTTGNRESRQPSRAGATSTRQSQQKATSNRQRRATTVKTQNRRQQTSLSNSYTKQRSATQKKSSGRSSTPKSPGNSTRQQPRVTTAPVRQTRQAPARRSTSQQSARSVSARVQKQSRPVQTTQARVSSQPRASSPPRASRSSGPKHTRSTQKAPRANTSKSSQKRSGSKSNGGGGKSRSRRG